MNSKYSTISETTGNDTYQHQVDLEMNQIGNDQVMHSERATGLARRRTKPNTYQQRLQDGYPTFVPTFASLRELCLKNTYEQIRELETRVELCNDKAQRDVLLDRVTSLLHDLDNQLKANLKWRQLEDPVYAAQRGVSLTHFTMDSGEKNEHWMLLTSDFGVSTNSIVESNPDQMTSRDREWLKRFCGQDVPDVVFKRKKSMLERQRGAVMQHGTIVVPNPRMKQLWKFLIALGVLVSIAFLSVAIIATTTTFDPFFMEYFFWISIVWVLAASTLLVALVRAFGADNKDSLSVFLAAVAIYLVIIQIGQTKLDGQLEKSDPQ